MPMSCSGATICCSMFPMVDLSPAQARHVSGPLPRCAVMHDACSLQQQRNGNQVEDGVGCVAELQALMSQMARRKDLNITAGQGPGCCSTMRWL